MTRDEAYSILYNLIFRGFLVGEMEIGKSLFVFKTITEREFNLIKACCGSQNNSSYLQRFNMNFMAHSVFAVDGENILADRVSKFPDLKSFFAKIPWSMFKGIMGELETMRNDSFNILKYMEGFCYTSLSRRMWQSLHGMAPNSEGFTGIPGTSQIGVNVHQESWMYVNRMIDNQDQYDREFSLSLFVASASNPKGARRTRNQHDSHMKRTEEHRHKLAREGFIDTRNWSESNWAAPVDTAEELVAELDRQMKGMKDRHDLFIEQHIKKVREEAERRTKEAEDRIRRAKEAYNDEPDLTVSQRPMTAEEVAKMYSKKPRTTRPVMLEESVTGENRSRILKKIGTRVLTARR